METNELHATFENKREEALEAARLIVASLEALPVTLGRLDWAAMGTLNELSDRLEVVVEALADLEDVQ